MSAQSVITRFPPSPTGPFHIGGARTALYNYLYALQNEGAFFLRIEDTDVARSKAEYEENMLESLQWLGIKSGGSIFKQSERGEIYKKYLSKMVEGGIAYISQEEAKEEGQRSEVIRFKNTGETIGFDDIVRGHITIDTTDLGDFVIAKSLEEPLYHLAVVIDDFETGVTHIIRGEDHISNTPRQILLQRAIGATQPIYAHIPMLLGKDKSKLSKRHGAASVLEYREAGYLPEALVNYIALLGWHPSESDQEIFTFEELVSTFKLEQVQKAGAVFDTEKLQWINREHILRLSDTAFVEHVRQWMPAELLELPEWSEERFAKVLPIIRERINTFKDITDMGMSGELGYFFQQPEYLISSIKWKDAPLDEAEKHLSNVYALISDLPEESDQETVKNALWDYAETNGKGNVLWPLRYALSGRDRSPNPFEIIAIIGKSSTLSRIDVALRLIKESTLK